MKTKREMREAAIKRLREDINFPGYYRALIRDIVGDDFDELTGHACVETIIDLLTDDEPQYEGDAFAKGPRDADGILWFRGDMSDTEWGVIERTYFDGERWLVRGHDLTAPWVPADSIRHAPMRTATQREDYLIKLPRDANGEVIHIGDEMVVGDYRYIVDGVGLAGRTDVFFVTDGDKSECFPAKVCRHYHKPTVEDVLREFSDEVQRCCDTEDTIAEYAEKLQLKED